MPGRRYYSYAVDIERQTKTDGVVSGGANQKIVTYPAVVSNVECMIQPAGVTEMATAMGIIAQESYTINFDVDVLPSGFEIREGDRVKVRDTGLTYVIDSALNIQDRVWNCSAKRKKA